MFSSAKIQDSPRALPPGPIAEVALDLESGAAGSTGAAAAGNSSAADSDKVIDVERALSLTLTVRERALARQNAKRWQTDTIWAFVFACVALAGEAVVLGLESQKYASRFTETTPIYLTEDSSSASTSDPPFALAPSAQHGTEFFYWSMFSLILVGAAAQLGSLISMGFFSSIFSDAMRRNGSFSYSEVITPVEFIVHGLTSLLGASSILLYTLISDTSTVNLWTGGFGRFSSLSVLSFPPLSSCPPPPACLSLSVPLSTYAYTRARAAFAIAAASGYASTIVRRRFYKRNRELLDGSSAWKVPQVLESVGSMEIATSVYLVSAAWIGKPPRMRPRFCIGSWVPVLTQPNALRTQSLSSSCSPPSISRTMRRRRTSTSASSTLCSTGA